MALPCLLRAIAARLDVLPGALYRHVRSKEQLGWLPGGPWTAQAGVLARRLRVALQNALLKGP